MTKFLLVLVVGKLLIYLASKFPLLAESKIEFVQRLFSCGLCSGVWIYSILSWGMSMYLFDDICPYVPVLSELVTGSVTSFMMHIFEIGWKEKFGVIVLE